MLDRDVEADLAVLQVSWLRTIRDSALAVFDEVAPLAIAIGSFRPCREERKRQSSVQQSREQGTSVPRIVEARPQLAQAFSGYGASGKAIFDALGLPTPEQRPKGRKSARSKETA
jgi:hypothetical protein